MTSAARPTFLPAMGGYSLRDSHAAPIGLQSAKMQKSYTKMKYRFERVCVLKPYRKSGQGLKTDLNESDLKKLLLEKEALFQAKKGLLFDVVDAQIIIVTENNHPKKKKWPQFNFKIMKI
jgi:hypothetical protein